jgi:selenocysteine lyase/cysteine desulfurase
MAAEEFNQSEIMRLVRDLVPATKSGVARWSIIRQDPETFALDTPAGSLTVHSAAGREHPYVLRLYDSEERKLFEMKTEVAPFYNASEAQLEDLFNAARDSVFDVSGTVERIRDSLGI